MNVEQEVLDYLGRRKKLAIKIKELEKSVKTVADGIEQGVIEITAEDSIVLTLTSPILASDGETVLFPSVTFNHRGVRFGDLSKKIMNMKNVTGESALSVYISAYTGWGMSQYYELDPNNDKIYFDAIMDFFY